MAEERRGILDWFSERLNLTEVFSLLTSYGLFYAELDSRKPLREALAEARGKPMPSYARWPRVLGLVVVVLIAVEIFTGVLLALYYLPAPQAAHGSLGTILRDVQFGWLVRQVHFWGSQLLLAVLILRLIRFFVQRVYERPRELLWVFAALLLLVCVHLDLSGRVLPMSATSYWSTVRALEVVSAVPVYGTVVVFLLGGDPTLVSDLTLIRFYVLHVGLLPLLALGLVYFHFSTVRRVGLAAHRDEGGQRGLTRFRLHIANLAILLVLVLGLLVSLAELAPVPYRDGVDIYTTVPGVGPPWYFLACFGFLEWAGGLVPRWLAGGLLLLGTAAFVAVPFMDRSRSGSFGRRLTVAAGLLAALAWLLLTLYGARVA